MNDSLLVCAIRKKKSSGIPFWFMRQAGRYLPEYREVRTKAGDFLKLCYTPGWAAEVTLQPVERFDVSAAIIFSDILVIPHAMGVDLRFEEKEGPRLSAVRDEKTAKSLKVDIEKHLRPVADAISKVRSRLDKTKSLIGFCGAPWTVACYMVEGKGSKDYEMVRRFALKEQKTFSLIMEKLVESSAIYLSMQVKAGADVIQIFDSWAGVLSETEYEKFVIEPTRKLVKRFKAVHPDVPVIGFPRGSGVKYKKYAEKTGVDAVSIDVQTPMDWARENIQKTLQGNLDPVLLAGDKNAAVAETKRLLEIMDGKPFIFNLGHGILQSTPLENVTAVCDAIRNYN